MPKLNRLTTTYVYSDKSKIERLADYISRPTGHLFGGKKVVFLEEKGVINQFKERSYELTSYKKVKYVALFAISLLALGFALLYKQLSSENKAKENLLLTLKNRQKKIKSIQPLPLAFSLTNPLKSAAFDPSLRKTINDPSTPNRKQQEAERDISEEIAKGIITSHPSNSKSLSENMEAASEQTDASNTNDSLTKLVTKFKLGFPRSPTKQKKRRDSQVESKTDYLDQTHPKKEDNPKNENASSPKKSFMENFIDFFSPNKGTGQELQKKSLDAT